MANSDKLIIWEIKVSYLRPHKVSYLFLVHPSFTGYQAYFFSKLSLNINFIIVYDFYFAYFPSVYAYLIALLFVCVYISCHIVSI